MIWAKQALKSMTKHALFDPHNRQYMLLLCLTLITVYALYLFFPIGTYDDYERAWNYNLSPETYGRDMFNGHARDGRLLTGLVLWLFFRPASIAYFGAFRLINLGLLLVLAVGMYLFFTTATRRRTAMLLTMIICLLPSFAIMFYFVSLMGVFAGAMLAGISAYLIGGVDSFKPLSRYIPRIFLAVVLMTAALQVYQPIAMFFWVFAAAALGFQHRSAFRSFLGQFAVYLLVFFVSLALAYLIMRAAPLALQLPYRQRAALISVEQIWQKIRWFIQEPLVHSLNFFLLYSIPMRIFLPAAAAIFCGLVLWFEGSLIKRLATSVILFAALPLAYFPNLIVQENWASYRSMIALSAVWVVLIFFGGKGFVAQAGKWGKNLNPAAQFAAIFWALLAVVLSIYSSVAYLILPGVMEQRFIHAELAAMNVQPGDTIYITPSKYYNTTSPYYYGDEFGIPTTTYWWGALNLTNLVLGEFGFSAGDVQTVIVEDPDAVPVGEPGAHHLDLRQISSYQLKPGMYPVERVKMAIDAFLRLPDN